jgi:tetratricopeptide (TPR) repeat protein
MSHGSGALARVVEEAGAAEQDAQHDVNLWQERQGHCLDCGKEQASGLPSGLCSECGAPLLRRAFRRDLEDGGQRDAALAESQNRALCALDFVRALGLAATRLRLAQVHRPSVVPAILLDMSAIFGLLGDSSRQHAYTERALALFREAGQSGGVALALCALGRMEQERGRLDSGLSRCHEALKELASFGDRSLQGKVELTMGHLLETSGLHAQGLDVYRRLAAGDVGNRVRLQAILGLGRCLLALGEYHVAFGCFEDALELSQQVGAAELRPHMALSQGLLFLTLRDVRLAEQCLGWAEKRLQGGDPAQRVELLLLRGRLALVQGHAIPADKLLQQAAEQAAAQHVSAPLAWARYYGALAKRAQTNAEEARNLARSALEKAQAQDLRELAVAAAVLLADLDRHNGPSAGWEELVRQAHTQARELRIPELLWRTSLAMAYLGEALGDEKMERRYLSQAVTVLDEMRQKYEQFRRGPLFFTDPEKLRVYQHWARRMLDWNERPKIEQAAEDCTEPHLQRTLQSILASA